MMETDADLIAAEAGRDFVKICEVGPRDGLQNEAAFVGTAEKIRYVDLLSRAGLPMIETTSFVHPKSIPALADAERVMRGIASAPGVVYLALVPNMRGFERARGAGTRAIAVFTAASETFVGKNIGMTIAESLAVFAPVVARARSEGVFVRGYVSTAFDCPYEGRVPIDATVEVAERLAALGIDELSIGDTIGAADPERAAELVTALQSHYPIERLAMHFHDTHGRAIANVDAAYRTGVRIFDAASGGLGGCPYAPGAGGNVATEKMLAHFAALDVPTGVDAAKVAEATAFIRAALAAA